MPRITAARASGGCGAGPRGQARRPPGGPARTGLGAPALDELLEGAVLEVVGQAAVLGAPALSLARVLDPWVRGDDHQARDALGCLKRDVQRDAPAERVAAQLEAFGGELEHVIDTALEGDGPRRVGGQAVPGEVDRERQVPFTVQQRRHAVPGAAGAAEAVE